MSDQSNLTAAFAAIDQVNAQDPNREYLFETAMPKELLYGQRMSERLQLFASGASEALQIAARAQHIKRWAIPRSDYPMHRAGYKRWRSELAVFHAELTGELLEQVGFGPEVISRVQSLLRKEKLKRDPECQALEDVICLVFIEHYLEDFAAAHDQDKVIAILQKTWRKMSDKGQQAALELQVSTPMQQLLKLALAG